MIFDETTNNKLTRIYVALEMTRQVAERGVITDETSQSMLTLVNVATNMLVELLDDEPCLSEPGLSEPEVTELEMLM